MVRAWKDRDDKTRCPRCDLWMQRVFAFVGQVSVPTFIPGNYPAFGKKFSTKDQLRDEIRKQKYEHGRDIVEVGNEKAAVDRIKPKRKEFPVEEAKRELYRITRHGRNT